MAKLKRLDSIKPRIVSETEVMELVKNKTINGQHIIELKSLTNQSDENISTWLGINVKTFRNYRNPKNQFPGFISEHIILLLSLFEHGIDVFGDKMDFDRWLNEGNFFFDGDSPSIYLTTISGIRFIDTRITNMEYGDNI
jgi:uncharacterized protein (DUF2384 family)